MCGRYASTRSAQDLSSMFGALDETSGGDVALEPDEGRLTPPPTARGPAGPAVSAVSAVAAGLEADWNVAPTKPVPVVLVRRDRDRPEHLARRLRVLRWGLVPSWASGPEVGSRMINARAETVAAKPAFRRAYEARRCLLPADGYYEWSTQDGERGVHFLARADGGTLAMAGLYEVWSPGPDAPLLWTAAVITTTATDGLGHIHERSPVLVGEPDWGRWLDPTLGGDAVADLLRPPEPGTLVPRPVARAVGDVRANGPHLLDPPRPAAQPALW